MFKKQEHCDPDNPADDQHGDWWDHTAYDAEHKLVLGIVPGARGAEKVEAVVTAVKQQTEDHPVRLWTSDDYPASEEAILHISGGELSTTPTGRASRRMVPERLSGI